MTARLLESLFAKRRLWGALALLMMFLSVLADWLKTPSYERFPWDSIGGFAALYGLFSCLMLIAIAKGLGYALLFRKPGYYKRFGEASDD